MLATLNLQNVLIEIAEESLVSPPVLPVADPEQAPAFAELLTARGEFSEAAASAGGEFVPRDGTELPLPAAESGGQFERSLPAPPFLIMPATTHAAVPSPGTAPALQALPKSALEPALWPGPRLPAPAPALPAATPALPAATPALPATAPAPALPATAPAPALPAAAPVATVSMPLSVLQRAAEPAGTQRIDLANGETGRTTLLWGTAATATSPGVAGRLPVGPTGEVQRPFVGPFVSIRSAPGGFEPSTPGDLPVPARRETGSGAPRPAAVEPDLSLRATVSYPPLTDPMAGRVAARRLAVPVAGGAAPPSAPVALNAQPPTSTDLGPPRQIPVDAYSYESPGRMPGSPGAEFPAAGPISTEKDLGQVREHRQLPPGAPPANSTDARHAVREPVKQPEILPVLQTDSRGEAIAETARPLGAKIPAQPALLQSPAAPLLATGAPAGPALAGDGLLPGTGSQRLTDLIRTPVQNPAWSDRMGERILLMAGGRMRSADIRLTPAELGPIRVQLSIDDGAAHVNFHTQNGVTRDAIEQALPRLREMLAENGLALGQASVGDQATAHGQADSTPGDHAAGASGLAGDESEADGDRAAAAPRRSTDGLVDTFA